MPLTTSSREFAQATLPYVTFQLDEHTLVACDLDGFELLRVPFRDELELNSREFMDTVAASVESLFPTAQPFWPGLVERPGGLGVDQSAAVAAALQEMYEEEDRISKRQERQRTRKDLKLARKLQLEEAMSGVHDELLVQNPAPWSSTPGSPASCALPEGDYPLLGPPVPKPKVAVYQPVSKLPQCIKEAETQISNHNNTGYANHERSRLQEESEGVQQPCCPGNDFVISKLNPGLQNVVLRLTATEEAAQRQSAPHFEPPSPGKQRRMMRGAEVHRRDPDSNAQGEADHDAEEARGTAFVPGLEDVSTKSFRKLIVDMMRKGWHPVKQGHSGHYKFERFVEELGGMKQMLMLAGTPSDCRYIWVLRSALARFDREVEEKLRYGQ